MCVLYVNLMDESIEGFRFLEFVGLCNQGNLKYGLLFHFWSVRRTEREKRCGMLYVELMDEFIEGLRITRVCWSVRRTERERVCVFYVKFMDEFIEGLQIAGILLVCLIRAI